jgi:hypothetical protein
MKPSDWKRKGSIPPGEVDHPAPEPLGVPRFSHIRQVTELVKAVSFWTESIAPGLLQRPALNGSPAFRRPLHLQIIGRSGRRSSGRSPREPFASSRAESRTLGVSRNVVLQAYGQLEAEGWHRRHSRLGDLRHFRDPDTPPPPKGAVEHPYLFGDTRRASHTMPAGGGASFLDSPTVSRGPTR